MKRHITKITLAGSLIVNFLLGGVLYSFYSDNGPASGGMSPSPLAIPHMPSSASIPSAMIAGLPAEWEQAISVIRRDRERLQADAPAHFWDIPPSSKRWNRVGLPLGTFDENKQFQIEEIEADYAELVRDLKKAFRGLLLATDAEQLRYLEAEKRKDLSAILSPDEMSTYDCWTSGFAFRLRSSLVNFQPTETEFRTLVRLQMEFLKDAGAIASYDKNIYQPAALALAENQRREALERECEDAIRDALGEERYFAYDRALTYGYGAFVALVEKQQLSQVAADEVFSLRKKITDECNRIRSETTQTDQVREARLKALADEVTARAKEITGEDFHHVQARVQLWTDPLREGCFLQFGRNSLSKSRGQL